MQWLKDLHWSLYYEHGVRWLSKPPKREWHVLLLPGMDPPLPRPGYTQVVTKLPEQMAGLMGGSQLPTNVHPMYGIKQTMQQMDGGLADQWLRDLFR